MIVFAYLIGSKFKLPHWLSNINIQPKCFASILNFWEVVLIFKNDISFIDLYIWVCLLITEPIVSIFKYTLIPKYTIFKVCYNLF